MKPKKGTLMYLVPTINPNQLKAIERELIDGLPKELPELIQVGEFDINYAHNQAIKEVKDYLERFING